MSSLPERFLLAMMATTAFACIGASSAVHGAAQVDAPLASAMAEAPEATHPVLLRMHGARSADALRLVAPGPERTHHVAQILRDSAQAAQQPVLDWLAQRNVAVRPYWLGNVIRVEATAPVIAQLALRDDVDALLLDRAWPQVLPTAQPGDGDAPRAVEASLSHIKVPDVWAAGVLGQDVVIAGQDTGYQWDHPALRASYRGWDGTAADHDYHWHDAIRSLIGGGSNSCGLDTAAPCDDNDHGTHTMGTMVGDDGNTNQIGIAPDARWIGCRNMEAGAGTPSTYTECFQWFIAPTTVAGSDPDPAMAPHVINNSWGCPPSEGCTAMEIALMEDVVDAVRAAGILVVASAGNDGSTCGTVNTPPGMYASAFSVGATGATSDGIAGFSSRGPTPAGLLKPDVTAPGVSIRSSIIGGGYASFSGTSMAGPHVAGVAALLMSVDPSLRRNPAAIETILRETAVPLTSAQTCGGFPGSAIPNSTFGHGRIDAWAAFRVAETIFTHGLE